MTLPSKERQYECMRIVAECYQNNNFDALYPLLSENVEWFSQWEHNNKPVWKDNVIKYYKTREKDFEWVFCETQIVELIWNMNEDSKIIWQNNVWQWRVTLMYDDWKLCVLMTKYRDWIQHNTMIDPEYEWDKISRIWICEPGFYKCRTWRPWNWEHVDRWKWIPNYKETDIMRDEELWSFACETMLDHYIKKEWYEILFASNFLNAFPNFVLKKEWKTILVIVRWCGAPNTPIIEKIEKDYFIQRAKLVWFDIYFAPMTFGSVDPDRFNKWLLLRWDQYHINFEWIIPLHSDSAKW